MPNLEKELVKSSKKMRKELDENLAIPEVTKLIENKSAEDFQMLNDLGMAHDLIAAQNIRGAQMERERLDKKYGKVYTLDEIESLATKYALKFLRSDNYRGHVDPTILQKIREFKQEQSMDSSELSLGFKFYILAPPKAFNLEDIPKTGMTFFEKFREAMRTDPILFFKIDDNHYRSIWKWGRDLTIYRRIIGWKYSTGLNYILYWTLLTVIPVIVAVNFLIPSYFWLFLSVIPIIIGLIRIGSDSMKFRTWNEETDQHEFVNNKVRYLKFWRTNIKAVM